MITDDKEFIKYSLFDVDREELRSKNEYLYQRFHEKFAELPDSIKLIILDVKTADFIKERLVLPNNLSEDQKNNLLRVLRDILMAEIYLGNAAASIKEKLAVDENKAREIINLFFTGLFSREILEELKAIHMKKFGQATPSSLLQPPQQAQSIRPAQPQETEIRNPNIINLRDRE